MNTRLIVIIISTALFTNKMCAQAGYHPLLLEGKEWHARTKTPTTVWDMYYSISGDTIISEETYKKLYIKVRISSFVDGEASIEEVFSTEPSFYAGLQECGSYVYMNRLGEKSLIYDFSLEAGDIAYETVRTVHYVTKTDTVFVRGIKRKRIWLSEVCTDNSSIETYNSYWVEGIGSSYGLEYPPEWNISPPMFQECFEDSVLIFSAKDFDAPSWDGNDTRVLTKGVGTLCKSTQYDFGGRLVLRKNGFRIKDGRKVLVR